MTDEQDQAEALDDEVVDDDTEATTDADRFVEEPTENYPPDTPLGVEDPGAIEIEDDLATCAEREQPET